MSNRWSGFLLLSLLFAANATMAQQPPARAAEPQLPVIHIPEPEDAPPPEKPPAVPALRIPRLPAEVTPHETGSAGDVLVDGSAPPFGVFLQAKTAAMPHVGAKLGPGGAGSFSVYDSDGAALWTVTPGRAMVSRNYNDATALVANNANPGGPGIVSSAGLWFMEGATLKSTIAVFGSGWTDAAGGPNAMRLMNFMNAPILFATNGTERMRILADGNIGVGTSAPNSKFRVVQSIPTAYGFVAEHISTLTADTTVSPYAAIIQAKQNVAAGVTNWANVIAANYAATNTGPGRVGQAVGQVVTAGVEGGGTVDTAYGTIVNIIRGGGTLITAYGLYMTDLDATNGYGIYQLGANDRNYFAGNVGIGGQPSATNALEVQGNANFSGTVSGQNIKANYQDLAEWVPASADMQAGTVVVLNRERSNEVMPSARSYDTAVAGVVSARPGIILGEDGPSKAQIATTGRVRVRSDATAAPIRIGDLLVTGNKPGVAMKSIPIDFQGVAIHRPGTVLGKALEPLEKGEGEILVLLSLQ